MSPPGYLTSQKTNIGCDHSCCMCKLNQYIYNNAIIRGKRMKTFLSSFLLYAFLCLTFFFLSILRVFELGFPLVVVCLILTHVTPATVKNTRSRGKGTNQRRWFGPQTWGSSVACCSSCSRRSEKGSIQQKVSFRPPIPTFPYGWTSVYSLCYLFTLNFPFLIKNFIQQHFATGTNITCVSILPLWQKGSRGQGICFLGC